MAAAAGREASLASTLELPQALPTFPVARSALLTPPVQALLLALDPIMPLPRLTTAVRFPPVPKMVGLTEST